MNRHLLKKFDFMIWLALAAIPASWAYVFYGLPYGDFVFSLTWLIAIAIAYGIYKLTRQMDFILLGELGNLEDYSSFKKTLPLYRYPDFYGAIQKFTQNTGIWKKIDSSHHEDLSSILNGDFNPGSITNINPPTNISLPIGPGQEEFFPEETFWIQASDGPDKNVGGVLRVRSNIYNNELTLEVAFKKKELAHKTMETIQNLANDTSIYKNQAIEVQFENEVRDEYGDIERHESVKINFKAKLSITEDEIILDNEVKETINRNVFDFHKRRKQLTEYGIPGKRGILFYGPPGTGKTFTCKHISTQLEGVTTLIAAGPALLHMRSVCNIARMLQPALVVLEDVDLVYSSRETNFNSASMGTLMDELDGFGSTDEIIFILTTNAIERIEKAIRDRPGRISQCIFFGPPSSKLRELYLNNLLQSYEFKPEILKHVVEQTEGATQAFLKELVFRTVQIASESESSNGNKLTLKNLHFDNAIKEMRSGAGKTGDSIIGFRVSSPND